MPNLDEYDDLNTNDANMNNDYDDDYDYDDEDEDDDDGYNRRPLKRGRVKKRGLLIAIGAALILSLLIIVPLGSKLFKSEPQEYVMRDLVGHQFETADENA